MSSNSKRVPDKIKKLKGTLKKSRVNELQPEPDDLLSIPDPPSDLPEVAKKEWIRVATILFDIGILSGLDLTGLASYCNTFAIWVRCNDEMAEQGLTVMAPSGYPIINPLLSQIYKSQKEMRDWLIQYGMTPAARANVSVDNRKKKSVKGFMD